ncbi:MAG: hypothetical protein IJ996_05560 [Clostridia bacterium]|nr:hypothetical protein [Clostridia bacterium]
MEEKRVVQNMIYLEDLASKKAAIYGRLLTEIPLAQTMERVSASHKQRMQALQTLLGEK